LDRRVQLLSASVLLLWLSAGICEARRFFWQKKKTPISVVAPTPTYRWAGTMWTTNPIPEPGIGLLSVTNITVSWPTLVSPTLTVSRFGALPPDYAPITVIPAVARNTITAHYTLFLAVPTIYLSRSGALVTNTALALSAPQVPRKTYATISQAIAVSVPTLTRRVFPPVTNAPVFAVMPEVPRFVLASRHHTIAVAPSVVGRAVISPRASQVTAGLVGVPRFVLSSVHSAFDAAASVVARAVISPRASHLLSYKPTVARNKLYAILRPVKADTLFLARAACEAQFLALPNPIRNRWVDMETADVYFLSYAGRELRAIQRDYERTDPARPTNSELWIRARKLDPWIDRYKRNTAKAEEVRARHDTRYKPVVR
jgi:hypothetical protein